MRIRLIILITLFLPNLCLSQAKIENIDFHGNNFFSKRDLSNYMVLKEGMDFNPSQLDLDLLSIRSTIKKNGFLFAKIDSTVTNFDSDSTYVGIDIYLDEGQRVEVGRIEFKGNSKLPSSELIKVFATQPGEILDQNTLDNDISELLTFYESKGLPFVNVSIQDINVYDDRGRSKLNIVIDIEENSRIQIDEVKIRGNDDTNDEVIMREIKLGKDKYITTEELEYIQDRLERLNIFQEVKMPRVYTIKGKNRSGLLIEVVEGNTSTFDGIIGYVPPENDTEDGYFTGLVNLSFRNLFGTGRRIEARWQQEVRETQELEFKYYEPYILSFPVNIGIAFLQRIQDSTYTRRRFDAKGEYLINDKFTISGIVGLDRVIPSDSGSSTLVIADSRILASGVELNFDNRNDVYFPTSGQYYTTNYIYGDKKIFNLDQLGPLGYKESYSVQKYSLDLYNFFSFFKRTALMVRGFGGEVRADLLEESDLFRIGGNNTIRGYREEQFLASRVVFSNIEARLATSRRNYFFGFYDFGYYERPADEINNISEQSGFIFGYGLGVTLETALGQIGVSYALGKGDGFLDGKIHFGLINNF